MLQVVQKEHFSFFPREQFGPLRFHCAQPPPQQENIKQSRHSERLLPHWKTQHNHFIPYSLQRKRVRGREKEREVILAQTCCLITPHAYAEKHLRDQTKLVHKSRDLRFQNQSNWSEHLLLSKHPSYVNITVWNSWQRERARKSYCTYNICNILLALQYFVWRTVTKHNHCSALRLTAKLSQSHLGITQKENKHFSGADVK